MAQDLGNIAIRVQRDGKWISAYIDELTHLTAAEVDTLACKNAVLELLEADPCWRYSPVTWTWLRWKELT